MTLIYLLIYFAQLAFYASWMHPVSVQIALILTFGLALYFLVITFLAEREGKTTKTVEPQELLFYFNFTALLAEGCLI